MENQMVSIPVEEFNRMTQQLDRMAEILEAQDRRQREMVELKDDVVPIVNHALSLIIDELAEVGMDFQLEDLLFIVKRVLRNTKLIMRMMDQLEAVSALGDEVQLLGPQVVSSLVDTLDELERKGVFTLARGSMQILESIAAAVDEKSLSDLGEKTGRAIAVLNEPVEKAPSLFTLLSQVNDPEVRTVLSRLLKSIKTLA